MYEISKTYSFDAAHFLPDHDGKCRNLHGHTYLLTVRFQADEVQTLGPKRGMVLDYADVDKAVENILTRCDHQLLNDAIPMPVPTAENLAFYFYAHINGWLRVVSGKVRLDSVTVSETPNTSATYRSLR